MKLNITIGGPVYNGYYNIDPITRPEDSTRIRHDIDNIDDLVDNNECDEVVAMEVLDAFPINVKDRVLKHWMSKVAHKGIIVVSGVDLDSMSNRMYFKHMQNHEINQRLYGACTNMWSTKKGLWTLQEVVQSLLSTNQFKILSKEISGINYIVKAERI